MYALRAHISKIHEKLRTVCEFGILLTYLLKFETKTPKKKKVLFLKNDNYMLTMY